MARNKGTFPFSATLEVEAAGPLDARGVVDNPSDLLSLPYPYKGMMVVVNEGDSTGVYRCIDETNTGDLALGWERVDGAGYYLLLNGTSVMTGGLKFDLANSHDVGELNKAIRYLYVDGVPSENNHGTNKLYVDSEIAKAIVGTKHSYASRADAEAAVAGGTIWSIGDNVIISLETGYEGVYLISAVISGSVDWDQAVIDGDIIQIIQSGITDAPTSEFAYARHAETWTDSPNFNNTSVKDLLKIYKTSDDTKDRGLNIVTNNNGDVELFTRNYNDSINSASLFFLRPELGNTIRPGTDNILNLGTVDLSFRDVWAHNLHANEVFNIYSTTFEGGPTSFTKDVNGTLIISNDLGDGNSVEYSLGNTLMNLPTGADLNTEATRLGTIYATNLNITGNIGDGGSGSDNGSINYGSDLIIDIRGVTSKTDKGLVYKGYSDAGQSTESYVAGVGFSTRAGYDKDSFVFLTTKNINTNIISWSDADYNVKVMDTVFEVRTDGLFKQSLEIESHLTADSATITNSLTVGSLSVDEFTFNGRDLTISNERAIVGIKKGIYNGTVNRLYFNYGNDFSDGVDISGTTEFNNTLSFSPTTGNIFSFGRGTKYFLKRYTSNGGLGIGCDDAVIIGAGESRVTIESNVSLSSESVHIGGESGVYLYSSPNNWGSGWNGRNTANLTTNGDFIVSNGSIYANDGIIRAQDHGLRTEIGAINGSWHHIQAKNSSGGTSSKDFYFNRPIHPVSKMQIYNTSTKLENNRLTLASSTSYDKIRVWGDSRDYAIGMHNGQANIGSVTDYAMTFTMNNASNRGFTFGYSSSGTHIPKASINAQTGTMYTSGYIASKNKTVATTWFAGFKPLNSVVLDKRGGSAVATSMTETISGDIAYYVIRFNTNIPTDIVIQLTSEILIVTSPINISSRTSNTITISVSKNILGRAGFYITMNEYLTS